jgi:hypothetical protein
MTAITPEAERLIDLLAERQVSPAAWPNADWERLIALAQRHSLAPILYARLHERGVAPPPKTLEQLRRMYLVGVTRNVRLFQELGKILRALQSANVPVIPLKGACLAEAVYSNVALRPMGDVDLLVKPHDMAHALEVLRILGYSSKHTFDPIAEQAISQHMPPISKPGGLTVEMHWTIVPPTYSTRFNADDLEQLWSHASAATIGGVSVLMFSPVDLLLHVCLHASVHHRFDGVGLRTYLDMAQVTRRYGDAIDWEQFTARANRWGIANGVRLALQLAGEWTNAAIPASVLGALEATPLDDATLTWVRHKILNGNSLALQSNVARFAGAARVRHQLAALRDAVFPSRLALAHMYPAPADSWRILGYYPIRFKDLWVNYGRTLWHVARRNHRLMTDARHEMHLRTYLGWQ